MTCRVVHVNKESYDVYIGRGRGSSWGNPYSHKDGTLAKFKTETRAEAVSLFEEYLLSNVALMSRLADLEGKVLGCWCKPQACHGDIIAKHVNRLFPAPSDFINF